MASAATKLYPKTDALAVPSDGSEVINGIRRIFDVVPSPDDPRDHVVESIYPVAHTGNPALPATLDLRKWLQEVRDQGRSSTCAAQTAATIKEYQEMRDTDVGATYSAEFVYERRVNAPKPGMYGRDVMHILHTAGIAPEHSAAPEDQAGDYKIAEYARVQSIAGLKEALATDGPCYIAFPTFNNSVRMWHPAPGETRRGGHAMAVVGYTKKGFLIRNSWGAGWGDHGHCVYPYADWGAHWEIWTAVDRIGSRPPIGKADFKQYCTRCVLL